MRHGGVSRVRDQPVETLVSEEADLLPFGARHIIAACVEVAQQNDVLQGDLNSSTVLIPIS